MRILVFIVGLIVIGGLAGYFLSISALLVIAILWLIYFRKVRKSGPVGDFGSVNKDFYSAVIAFFPVAMTITAIVVRVHLPNLAAQAGALRDLLLR